MINNTAKRHMINYYFSNVHILIQETFIYMVYDMIVPLWLIVYKEEVCLTCV